MRVNSSSTTVPTDTRTGYRDINQVYREDIGVEWGKIGRVNSAHLLIDIMKNTGLPWWRNPLRLPGWRDNQIEYLSRRPHFSPKKTSSYLEELIVEEAKRTGFRLLDSCFMVEGTWSKGGDKDRQWF